MKFSKTCDNRGRSGSVVECLTGDRRAAGSSLTGVMDLYLTTKESRRAKIGSDVYYFSMWFKTSDQSEFYISTELLISGLLMCIGFIGITDFK